MRKLTNGCTLSPDLWIRSCCDEHDLRYATGSSRALADLELRQCIYMKTYSRLVKKSWAHIDAHAYAKDLAWTYYLGVRVFGLPFWLLGHMKWRKRKCKKHSKPQPCSA